MDRIREERGTRRHCHYGPLQQRDEQYSHHRPFDHPNSFLAGQEGWIECSMEMIVTMGFINGRDIHGHDQTFL
jgi:hypothetical protein